MAASMDRVSRMLSTAFETDRLRFRPMELSEKHLAFAHRVMQDPLVVGLARTAMLKLMNRKAYDDRLRPPIETALLAMMIVLKPQEVRAKPGENGAVSGEGSSNKGDDGPDEEYVGWFFVNKMPHEGLSTFGIASIGIVIAPGHSSRGLGTEVLNWILDWCFQYGGLRRVELDTVSFNERAIAVYKKVGFVEEGRRRKFQQLGGEWFDNVMLGILDEEYWALRKNKTLLSQQQ